MLVSLQRSSPNTRCITHFRHYWAITAIKPFKINLNNQIIQTFLLADYVQQGRVDTARSDSHKLRPSQCLFNLNHHDGLQTLMSVDKLLGKLFGCQRTSQGLLLRPSAHRQGHRW